MLKQHRRWPALFVQISYFEEGELKEEVVSSILEHTTQHVAIKGKTQETITKFYNLDAIISVGYRVNSSQATAFRICN